ncbi:MAG: hypothetical protein M3Z14_01450 [Candidatus Eremiobacteraeota bacterium]|nr:hypothetical protein [Candidatus Eremiobacteraeota bacterium]
MKLTVDVFKLSILMGFSTIAACSGTSRYPNDSSVNVPALVPANSALTKDVAQAPSTMGLQSVTSSLGRIGLFQVFDSLMTAAQRTAAGPRYDLVWGAKYPPSQWSVNHPSIVTTLYSALENSDSSHDLAYYKTYHPDWILYNCTANGTPTHVIAYMGSGTAVPLDIHNPAVVNFQVRTLKVPPAIAGGYNALAIDQVVFRNFMGGNAGSGSYACGVWENTRFVKHYTSKTDTHWALDVVNWFKAAKNILSTDPVIAPHHLKLVINHPASDIAGAYEQQLLANVDGSLSEVGFSDYGNYKYLPELFKTALDYMMYAQAHGVTALAIDKFVQATPLTPVQREWAVATYLMANNGNAFLFATYSGRGKRGYDLLNYYPEYDSNIGKPCGAVTGGPVLYERKFQNGLVVVNPSMSKVSMALSPSQTKYRDIEGRAVSNPLIAPATDAFVLLAPVIGTGCR